MTKRQLIDEIVVMNQTAEPEFLAKFQDEQLDEYLQHLRRAQQPRLSGDASRYQKYFSRTQAPAPRATSRARQTVPAQEAEVFELEEDISLPQVAVAESELEDDTCQDSCTSGQAEQQTCQYEADFTEIETPAEPYQDPSPSLAVEPDEPQAQAIVEVPRPRQAPAATEEPKTHPSFASSQEETDSWLF